MSEEEKEIEVESKKPKLELLKLAGLSAVELCNPINDQINKIKVCYPNIEGIEGKKCNPVEQIKDQIKCLPDVIGHCQPVISCNPLVGPCYPAQCNPVVGPCQPVISCSPVGPCGPWVQGPCGPSVVEDPSKRLGLDKLEEINDMVKKLTTEVEALKKKIR